MTNELPDTGKRTQGMVGRHMLYRYCSCGHPIGIEKTSDPHRFYDRWDWNEQVETCPSCGRLIEASELEFSEEQLACLDRVYRRLCSLAREAEQSGE